MKDFNNIEADPIPEGLEFNESYMQDAFALYDAEKQKRKRRLLIWWITSALGFSAVLLIGIFFFTRDETVAYANKKQAADEKTETHQPASDAVAANTSGQQTGNTQNEYFQPGSEMEQNKAATISTPRSSTSMGLNTRITTRRIKSEPLFKKNRNKKPAADKVIPERNGMHVQSPADRPFSYGITSDDTIHTQRNEIAESEAEEVSGPIIIESIDLPLKQPVLAFSEDSTSKLPAYEQPIPILAAENDLRKSQVHLNLGVNTLFGMTELKNKPTFRESIGISYNYRINPKLSIGAGLEYHSISRISYKRKIGDTTNSDKTTTILNKTTLNYISFSPQVHYHLWPNHTLNAGFGIEYLLVDPGERYEIDNYTQETPKRTNSKLYYSTFNRFNFSVSLGYTYQFSRFMAVHASYYYGFTDITRNTDFNKTFDRNSRLQIGLKIKLY